MLLAVDSGFAVLAVFCHVLDEQVGVQDQVFGVGRLPGMLLQLEGASWHHAPQVAAGLGPGAVGAQCLHAQQGQQAALAVGISACSCTCIGLGVVAASRFGCMPLVDLALGLPGRARVASRDTQIRPGPGVVVVPGGVLPAGELVLGNEAVDVLGIDLPAGGVVFHMLVQRIASRIGAHGVREHQAVFAVRMLEVVADAPFLAQAGKEGEVALVELGLVVAHGVVLDQAFVHGEGVAAQEFVQDLNDAEVLEDPAVGAQGGQVQPGAQGELVLGVAPFLAPQGCVGDQGVELARGGAIEFDLAADLLADEGIQVEVGAGRDAGKSQRIRGLEKELVGKEAVEPFMPRQPHGRQCSPTKNNRDRGRRNRQRARHRRLP
ncbi:hypothetical protein FQZ97_816160 [compost metagenome]